MLDWKSVQELADEEAKLYTITRKPFRVIGTADETVTVEVSTGRQHTVSRENLARAVDLIRQGEQISGPADYRAKVADDRPTYAWAILHHLEYL